MTKQAIIGARSNNPVTVNLDPNTNWTQMDKVTIPPIEGEFEVRLVYKKGQNTTYSVMPIENSNK